MLVAGSTGGSDVRRASNRAAAGSAFNADEQIRGVPRTKMAESVDQTHKFETLTGKVNILGGGAK